MARQEAGWSNAIRISKLKEWGYLNGGWRIGTLSWSYLGEQRSSVGFQLNIGEDEQHIRLYYTHTDSWTNEKSDMNFTISLISTPCRYGGKRYWFICPLSKNGVYCGRRVGVIFIIGKWYGCRHCGNICYASQNRGGKYRGSSVTAPDIDEAEKQVKRYYYRGKPTRKYRRVIRLNEKFEHGFLIMAAGLDKRFGGFANLKK